MPADTAVGIETPAEDVELEISPSFRIDLQPPPFAEVHGGPEYSNTSVTLELKNDSRSKGKLMQFDSTDEIISIMRPRGGSPTVLDMNHIKCMHREKP